MTTTAASLTEFLLARIAEDEAVARRVRGTAFGEWRFIPDPAGRLGGYVAPGGAYPSPATAIANDWSGQQVGAGYVSVAEHVARHNPAHVLAECEAHRRIVGLHSQADFLHVCRICGTSDMSEDRWPCRTLLAVGAIYSDHPDYDEAWR